MTRPPDTDGDEALIVGVRAGDTAALAELYHRYSLLVYGAAYRCLGSDHDAEDVLQDIFVGLPEALQRYEETGRFASWLKRVAIRAALMRIRARGRRREEPLDHVSRVTSGEPDVIDQVTATQAIRALPDELRVVFMLKEVEGYSHAEIAALLGLTSGASAVRLFRAWRLIRAQLGTPT
jgi:RNA polymerase sigma-70 factor, ECF subfamily